MKKILLLSLTIFIFSCGEKKLEEKTNTIVEPVKEDIVLTSTQRFLKENGMNENAKINDNELLILEKAVELGLFNDKSFCQFYEEFKTLDYAKKYKESEKMIASLNKVEKLDFLMTVKGYDLCPEALARAKENRYGKRITYQEVKINPCVMSEDFIKRDLRYPSTAKFSIFNCSSERNDDGSYTVLRKVSAKNAFGVESEFVYKVRMGFTGGVDVDINNWKLIGIVSEEYRK